MLGWIAYATVALVWGSIYFGIAVGEALRSDGLLRPVERFGGFDIRMRPFRLLRFDGSESGWTIASHYCDLPNIESDLRRRSQHCFDYQTIGVSGTIMQ